MRVEDSLGLMAYGSSGLKIPSPCSLEQTPPIRIHLLRPDSKVRDYKKQRHAGLKPAVQILPEVKSRSLGIQKQMWHRTIHEYETGPIRVKTCPQ